MTCSIWQPCLMHKQSCKQRKVRMPVHTCIGCTSCACSPGSSRWAACTWGTAWCGPESNSDSRSLRCSSGSMCALCRSPPAHTLFILLPWHGMPHKAVMWPVPLLSGHMGATGQDWQAAGVSEDSGRIQQAARPGRHTALPETMLPYFSPSRDVPKQVRLANGDRLIGCSPACAPPQCTGSRRQPRTCS